MQRILTLFRTFDCPRAKLLFSAVILAVFVAEAYIFVSWGEGSVPLPPLFGNFERIRATLTNASEKDEFTFAIAGDTRGLNGIFERISDELHKTPLDFAVLLGDCAGATESDHRFFRAECSREYGFSFPVFYVVGNHDIDPRSFPLSRFEELYGPSIFSFDYQGCLFIVLRTIGDSGSNQANVEFLKSLASKGLTQYRRVFVFMHIPPPVPAFDTRKFRAPEEFIPLFEQLHVDCVCASHYHGYSRTELGTTTYLVTGGGGATLDRRKYAQFHHALAIRVGKDYIAERIIPGPSSDEFEDGIEGLAITAVYPWLSSHRVAAFAVNAGLLCALLALAGSLCRGRFECGVATRQS